MIDDETKQALIDAHARATTDPPKCDHDVQCGRDMYGLVLTCKKCGLQQWYNR